MYTWRALPISKKITYLWNYLGKPILLYICKKKKILNRYSNPVYFALQIVFLFPCTCKRTPVIGQSKVWFNFTCSKCLSLLNMATVNWDYYWHQWGFNYSFWKKVIILETSDAICCSNRQYIVLRYMPICSALVL